MVEIYIPEQQYDSNIAEKYFDVTKVGTLDVLGATLDETFYYNPLNAVERFFEQKQEELSRGRIFTPEEYQESEYFRPEIEVGPQGIKEGVARLLAERKDKRDAFNLTLSRSRGGLKLGAMQFATGIAGSLLDPLNIASAFVPVVSTARAATFAARYGKNGGRFVSGVVDGVAGAALLEIPINLQANYEQDKDYGLMDSFLNVTFGGIMGGGLHVGFGKLSDRINASKQNIKDQALTTSIAQAVNDQEISGGNLHQATANLAAENIIRRAQRVKDYDPTVRSVERTFDDAGNVKNEVVVKDKAPGIEEVTQFPTKGKSVPNILKAKKPKTLIQFIKSEGGVSTTDANIGDVKAIVDKNYFSVAKTEAKGGKTLDELLSRAREEGYIAESLEGVADDFSVSDFLDLIQEDLHSASIFSRLDNSQVVEFEKSKELQDLADFYGINPAGMTDETFLTSLSEFVDRQERIDFNTAQRQGDLTEQEFYDLRDEALSEDYNLGNMVDHKEILQEMDEASDTVQDIAINELLQESELLLADLQNSEIPIPSEFMREIEAADDLIAKSENFEEVTRLAAECMNRNYKR
jgi:hypothetical protein